MKTWLITALVNFHAMRGDMADEARDSISSEEVTTLQSLASCNLKNIEVKSFQQHLTLEKKFSTTSNTGEKVVKQVTVGHWGNVMPPVTNCHLLEIFFLQCWMLLETFFFQCQMLLKTFDFYIFKLQDARL